MPVQRAETDLRLGPAPVLSILVLADLGMSDEDIARYFFVGPQLVGRFREMASTAELSWRLPDARRRDRDTRARPAAFRVAPKETS